MDSNRKFIGFRELLSNEIVDGGQIIVIPYRNVRKAEAVTKSPKITDPSKILIHVGVNILMINTRRILLTTLYLLQKSFKRNLSATCTYQT